MGFGILYGLTLIFPSLLFLGILWSARLMNLGDPWMMDVVLRQYKYRRYYAPAADLGVDHPQIRDFI